LTPELNHALEVAGPGQVSAPIQTANGFHILGVRSKRTISLGAPDKATLDLEQVFHSYEGTDKDALVKTASRVRTAVKSCSSLEKDIASFPGWKSQKLGNMTLSTAPGWLAEKVRNVAAGSSSEPLVTEKGVIVLFVCSRNEDTGVDRDAIMHTIGTEKLELQARRLLRDLRRGAFMDIRLGKDS
jgi:peptidyl-prolyl cis-trans isomerase SurA